MLFFACKNQGVRQLEKNQGVRQLDIMLTIEFVTRNIVFLKLME